jgi:uncharacterized protein (UPF0332 family)/predicted nucleotidyltransferase
MSSSELPNLSLSRVLDITEELRSLLWKRYGPRFRGVVLYGSCARGDHDDGSDIDLLVLMDDGTDVKVERGAIQELAQAIDCRRYGTVLSPMVVREAEYQRGKAPFYLNVKREGISFAPGDRIDMQPEIEVLIVQARRNLRVAEAIFDGGDYDIAASRAYYAMFYAAEAVLLSKGIARSRHTGVIDAFNQYFVNTGLLPRTLHTALNGAFIKRNQADYSTQPFSREDGEALLRDAVEFVGAVERFLAEQPA